jgi:hypothetical protein
MNKQELFQSGQQSQCAGCLGIRSKIQRFGSMISFFKHSSLRQTCSTKLKNNKYISIAIANAIIKR